eukprot:TRINITY_DN38862_c0_g1_i1.p1 TRINITY_DN38862_c0_g1~~TRINITY_DN38862_c0_g1_i1.p1  ORF type:complete len:199 (+),score=-6.45 TRINITY_DN38862_c0_g1_i1:185-781(+)
MNSQLNSNNKQHLFNENFFSPYFYSNTNFQCCYWPQFKNAAIMQLSKQSRKRIVKSQKLGSKFQILNVPTKTKGILTNVKPRRTMDSFQSKSQITQLTQFSQQYLHCAGYNYIKRTTIIQCLKIVGRQEEIQTLIISTIFSLSMKKMSTRTRTNFCRTIIQNQTMSQKSKLMSSKKQCLHKKKIKIQKKITHPQQTYE